MIPSEVLAGSVQARPDTAPAGGTGHRWDSECFPSRMVPPGAVPVPRPRRCPEAALADRRLIDEKLIAARTEGFADALDAARSVAPTLAAVATVQIALVGALMLITDRFVSLSRVV